MLCAGLGDTSLDSLSPVSQGLFFLYVLSSWSWSWSFVFVFVFAFVIWIGHSYSSKAENESSHGPVPEQEFLVVQTGDFNGFSPSMYDVFFFVSKLYSSFGLPVWKCFTSSPLSAHINSAKAKQNKNGFFTKWETICWVLTYCATKAIKLCVF